MNYDYQYIFSELSYESPYALAANLSYFIEKSTRALSLESNAILKHSNSIKSFESIALIDTLTPLPGTKELPYASTYQFFAKLIQEVGISSSDIIVMYLHLQRYYSSIRKSFKYNNNENDFTNISSNILSTKLQVLCSSFTAISMIYDETLTKEIWMKYSGLSWSQFLHTTIYFTSVFEYICSFSTNLLCDEYIVLRDLVNTDQAARSAYESQRRATEYAQAQAQVQQSSLSSSYYKLTPIKRKRLQQQQQQELKEEEEEEDIIEEYKVPSQGYLPSSTSFKYSAKIISIS